MYLVFSWGMTMVRDDRKRKRILILGGGFGGIYTATALEKSLGRHEDVEIVLINRENYMVFQPMLAEIISGSIEILHTIAPIRRLCPTVTLHVREVESIDLENKVVSTSPGFRPHAHTIEYDYLVLALGNVLNFSIMPGLEEHALPYKNLGDAILLRNHVIHALEEADIEEDQDLRRRLLTFVVAGGGFSGVEVAAELNDVIRRVVRHYRHISLDELNVILLHRGPHILPELPEELGIYAQNILRRRGVDIRLNTRLTTATADEVALDTGERIPTKTCVSTVPGAPHPLVAGLPCQKELGRVVVNEFLEVPGYPGVWALGDCAFIIDQKTGKPCAPTAQYAVREGRCIAHNILATLRGTPKQPFSFSVLGLLSALGHRSAVAQVFLPERLLRALPKRLRRVHWVEQIHRSGMKFSGLFAWFLWRAIYLMKLPGLDRKVRVAADWLLDMLLPPDIVQLRTARTQSLAREHLEPGEIVFRQGDLGDRLYIIEKGEVEVVREEDGGKEKVLATLGPGQYFGEMALVSDEPRMATVRPLTGVDVLTIQRGAFRTLFTHLPSMRETFEEVIKRRQEG
jgi:NADH:ubiquinone reductase (H+-translocating)